MRKYLNEALVNIYIDKNFADEIVESVFLGINKDKPDREIKIDYSEPDLELRFQNVKYVSSYLKFKDGTTSESRIKNIN